MAIAPLGVELADIMADTVVDKIVFARNGGQIRTVVTGTKIHETFMYPSKRWRRCGYGDGRTELAMHKIAEVVPDRLDFLAQPCRIEATLRGKAVTAFPDAAWVDIGGRPMLVEAKRRWEDFDRPTAIIQQAVTRVGAAALGWDYHQVTPANLGSDDFLEAVDEVQAHRFVNVPLRIEQAVARALSEEGELQLGDLAHAMGESFGRGLAFASALMVRRKIAFDLHRPVDERSIVRPAPKRPFAFPTIRLSCAVTNAG
ncbi:hypothetical protein [Sphingomonas sp.]|uniref:hypothetical protein n=1 Tax=Sphingomonas sp. TaxID=28214 RepID=UPI001EC50B6A|nr:hypothetical protein [Sphingomonas sp.]MBX3595069.1 hypothetical protein [Sphingomonas sp.]